MKDLVLVGLGGFIGSISRYGVSLIFLKSMTERPYFGTLAVNLAGSLIIGILAGYASKLNHSLSLFLIVGFCGGFTTFSTFSMDGIRLLKAQLYGDFILYATVSMVGGLALCALGYLVGSK